MYHVLLMVAIELHQFEPNFKFKFRLNSVQRFLHSVAANDHSSITFLQQTSILITPITGMKTSLAVAFLQSLDQDRKSLSCDLIASRIGENPLAPSFSDTLNLFPQKQENLFAESMVTDAGNIGRQTQSLVPERRCSMMRKKRPGRAPINMRRKINPCLDELLNRGHTTGMLIERLELSELGSLRVESAEEEFESIEELFEQYDTNVNVENSKPGKPCMSNIYAVK